MRARIERRLPPALHRLAPPGELGARLRLGDGARDAVPNGQRPPERARGRLRWGRLFHTAVHAIWSLILFAAATLAWLWISGLPGPIKQGVLDRLGGDRYSIRVAGVYLDPTRGFTLRDFEMSGPAPLGDAFLRARSDTSMFLRSNLRAFGPCGGKSPHATRM